MLKPKFFLSLFDILGRPLKDQFTGPTSWQEEEEEEEAWVVFMGRSKSLISTYNTSYLILFSRKYLVQNIIQKKTIFNKNFFYSLKFCILEITSTFHGEAEKGRTGPVKTNMILRHAW